METKNVVSWWNDFKLWQKIGMILTPFAMGGEAIMVVNHAHWAWHAGTVVATIVCIYTTKVFTDKDGNGKIDQFER